MKDVFDGERDARGSRGPESGRDFGYYWSYWRENDRLSDNRPPGGGGGLIFLPVIVVLFLFGAFAITILYPFAVILAVAAAAFTLAVPALTIAKPQDWVLLVAGLLGLIVLVMALRELMRWDHRLAEHTRYRQTRHLFRLASLTSLGAVILVNWDKADWNWSLTTVRDLLSVVRSFPERSIAVAAAIVGFHFLLTVPNPIRKLWHRGLAYIGMDG